jgi:superfamily II DNA or RNA helicase
LHPIRAEITQIIQKMIQSDFETSRADREKFRTTPLHLLLPSSRDKGKEKETDQEENERDEVGSKRKREEPRSSKSPPKKKTESEHASILKNYPFRFGELDVELRGWQLNEENSIDSLAPNSWVSFWTTLQEDLNFFKQKLWDQSEGHGLAPFRLHQVEALQAFADKILSSEKPGKTMFFDMATGTGKTKIFTEIIKVAIQNLNGNIAVVLPDLTIHDQVVESIAREVSNVVPISSKQDNIRARDAATNIRLNDGRQILVYCLKSFWNFLDGLKGSGEGLRNFSLIVYDEIHKLSSADLQFVKSLNEDHKGLILGFSATPGKAAPYFGDRVFSYTTQHGIEDGVLAPWITRSVSVSIQSEDKKAKTKEWAQLIPHILETNAHPVGGLLKDHRGVIYVNSIPTADAVAGSLRQKGIPAAAFHSQIQDRKAIIQRFKNKKLNVLIAVRTLREGFDAPMDYVFVTQPDRLRQDDLIQIRGRALRKDLDPEDGKGKLSLFLLANAPPEVLEKFRMRNEQDQPLHADFLNLPDEGIYKIENGKAKFFKRYYFKK